MTEPTQDPSWERKLIERLAESAQTEQRRSRRWNVFFRFLFFAYLVALLALFVDWSFLSKEVTKEKHTARVELKGVIAEGSDGAAEKVNKLLRAAFKDKNTKGVVLEINSPGGTPVQASYIYDEIKRLREEYPDIKLYAVVTDICASGGYYVAAAADEIYAAPSSIVGSIGVRLDNFGLQGLLEKIGVENRTITAGENKAILDPFQPLEPEQRAHLEGMLARIHQQFIDAVKAGRGDRLKPAEELFSGLIWTGDEAVAQGLVDGLRSTGQVARDLIGAETIVTYEREKSLLEQLTDASTDYSVRLFSGILRPGLQ
ncbi:MAG: signal peptide peptidase SppA [Thiotrichales bacterium]